MVEEHRLGHRERLKNRFIKAGIDSLQDYEILELFLFNSIPRKDIKPIAKELLNHFGNLYNVLNANDFELTKIKGIGEKVATDIKIAKALMVACDRSMIQESPININEYSKLIKYLTTLLAHKTSEEMWVLTFDAKGKMISSKMMFQGSVNSSAVSSREIIKSILLQQAVGVMLCHNHPSGDPLPSPQDINFTMQFQQALMTVDQGITFLDHIIIGKQGYYSFAENGKM